MRKSDLIRILNDIPGDPEIGMPHPAIVGALTTSLHVHEDRAGKKSGFAPTAFPTLYLQRYYSTVIKNAAPVIILSTWPKI